MKCTGGRENYKCLMNYKINTKVKPCTNCWTWQASLEGDFPLSLLLFFWKFDLHGAENTTFCLTRLSKWEEILGRKMRDQASVVMSSATAALKLSTKHIFSSRNREQRAAFLSENKEQLSYRSFLNNINYSLQCPKQVGPLRRSLRIEHNKFRSDHWQPQMLLLRSQPWRTYRSLNMRKQYAGPPAGSQALDPGSAFASGWSLVAHAFQPLDKVLFCKKEWWRGGWGMGQILDGP